MTIPLGICGKMFGHFEPDQQFKPVAKPIVDMYEHACDKTFYFSKHSVPNGKYKQKALVWLAAATALHSVLGMYATSNNSFRNGPDEELDYSWLIHLANEAEGEDE
jgi:hypothetical protein